MLRSSAYLGGADFNHYWANQGWAFDAFVTGSLVRGDPGRDRRPSARRRDTTSGPMPEHFSLDTTRTSLAGYNGVVSLTKLSGRWLGSLTLQDKSPGTRPTTWGSRSSRIGARWPPTSATPTTVRVACSGTTARTSSPRTSGTTTGTGSHSISALKQVARFRNFWKATLTSHFFPATSDDHLTRGGPLADAPAARELILQIDSDSRHRHTFGLGTDWFWDVAGTHYLQLTPSLTLSPGSNLQIALSPT